MIQRKTARYYLRRLVWAVWGIAAEIAIVGMLVLLS
jgi:hypothetical protein